MAQQQVQKQRQKTTSKRGGGPSAEDHQDEIARARKAAERREREGTQHER